MLLKLTVLFLDVYNNNYLVKRQATYNNTQQLFLLLNFRRRLMSHVYNNRKIQMLRLVIISDNQI